ncbi:hypothetical protein Ae406Ps2_6412 [Pseudonocardia sp. Ae406_Ps2]|nr:hypothetical protein Ae406Ps2_6412 [Pseudonocardia sp. Ae406_Ps2]
MVRLKPHHPPQGQPCLHAPKVTLRRLDQQK